MLSFAKTVAVPAGVKTELFGNPVRPATNPNGTSFTGSLHYASVFGLKNLLNDPLVYGLPNISLTNFSGYGFVADPNGQLTNLYQIINHMTLIRGAHNFKFGADLRKTNFNDVGDRNQPFNIVTKAQSNNHIGEPIV